MSTIKRLIFIALVLSMVVCTGQVSLALIGSSSGDTPSLTIVPTASGTKLEGPLTLYFPDEDAISMYMFLRLRKGSTWYAFSGSSTTAFYDDISSQQTAVENFFKETVLPYIYGGVNTPTEAFLKSVDQIVSDIPPAVNGPDCCNEMQFVILDVVIAVKD